MIKNKINDVISYFKTKILHKEYIITNIYLHSITILIDDKYYFHLWMSNGYNSLCLTENGSDDYIGSKYNRYSFIDIKFNEQEKIKIYNDLKNVYKEYLEKEIEKIKNNEITNIKNILKNIK